MSVVLAFPRRATVPATDGGALSAPVMLQALLFECAMLVDPFSPDVLALYRAYTGATRADPDAVHQWMFVEARERVALVPAFADIALRTGRISGAVYVEIMTEMAELLRQVRECA